VVFKSICFVLQPSVRGLFSAIASVRQKLDNIMPTLTGAEEAVQLARKFLVDRVTVQQQQHLKRRDSNVSIMSSISQLGTFTTVFACFYILTPVIFLTNVS